MTTEEKLKRCGIEMIGPWAILATEQDFYLFHDFVRADYPAHPDEFPCAAMEAITADESTEYRYILMGEIIAIAEKMGLQVKQS